jgi:hypothetical protein
MKREAGEPSFPIWLLGDSEPRNWNMVLDTPLDPRHPARHNIWTPVLDVMQDRFFRERQARMNTKPLFIRNAIGDPQFKPAGNVLQWPMPVEDEIQHLHRLLEKHHPKLILSFGAFAFEFGRRALNEAEPHPYSYWSARQLGNEFRRRCQQVDVEQTNLLPLLHATIARGRFIQSHEQFCGDQPGTNYFKQVGNALADVIISRHDQLSIWIRPDAKL